MLLFYSWSCRAYVKCQYFYVVILEISLLLLLFSNIQNNNNKIHINILLKKGIK